jgi:hypothetical protein
MMDFPNGQDPADFMRNNDPNRKNSSREVPPPAAAGATAGATTARSTSDNPPSSSQFHAQSSSGPFPSSSRERRIRRQRDTTTTTTTTEAAETSDVVSSANQGADPFSSWNNSNNASSDYHGAATPSSFDSGRAAGFPPNSQLPQHHIMSNSLKKHTGESDDVGDNDDEDRGGVATTTTRNGHGQTNAGPNFLSKDMNMLSLSIQEPNEPTDNPMVATNAHDMYNENDYQQYQSQQQHHQHSRPARSVQIPEPRAGVPSSADSSDTLRQSRTHEPTLPERRLGRRCLTEKRSRRLPDRVMGILVDGDNGAGGKSGSKKNLNDFPPTVSAADGGMSSTVFDEDPTMIIIECIDCKVSLEVPKYAIIVECPNCQGVSPVASCQVGRG